MNKPNNNWFERNPKKTIVIFLFIAILILDCFAANIYKRKTGFSFANSKWIRGAARIKEINRAFYRPSDIYHHDLAKNKSAKGALWGNITYAVCTNSLGFRDKSARVIPLVADKYRIIFIGDSFTEGIGVDYQDSFVGLIDSALSEKDIEVLNAAVISYSPIIYWRKIKYLIEDAGLKFNELVVFLDISDAYDDAICYSLNGDGNIMHHQEIDCIEESCIKQGAGNPALEIAAQERQYKDMQQRLKSLVADNTVLIYTVLNAMHDKVFPAQKYAISKRRALWTIDEDSYRAYGQKGLKEMAFNMEKLYRLLKENNIKLTVAVYPWPDQVINSDLDSLQVLFWSDWCNKHNIEFINYFPYFISGRSKEDREAVLDNYYFKEDIHLNKQGHRLIADVFINSYGNKQ